ncbi:ComEA family DNA-binding protein [Geodermatophilus sp. SYSU D00700]
MDLLARLGWKRTTPRGGGLGAATALVVVLAGAGPLLITTATPAHAAPPPPAIDLASPEATVQDPVADLAPVNTECHSGQVDLNTASAAELSSALRLPSQPTVGRIIALRPWLKGADLSSVPGIGPSTAAALAPRTCATQAVLPAAAPRACTTATQVDLQSASAATISSRLGLPGNTANALVAARPLPQNLTQVTAPRVPGFPQPTVDSLIAAGKICVTPAPMLAGGSAWRWATTAGGAVVRRDGYALIVPPGRVTAPTGAYISVTPLPPTDGALPHLDAHIWGSWAAGATTVAVQSPWSADGQPGARPVFLHDAADGTHLSTGDAVALSTVNGVTTATTALYSLSESSVGTSVCNPNGLGGSTQTGPNPLCLQALTDGSLAQAWLDAATAQGREAMATVTRQPSCLSTGTNPVAASLGELPWGIACEATQNPAGTATWNFLNNATTDANSVNGAVLPANVIYDYSVHGGTSTHYVDGPGDDANPLADLLIREIRNHTPFLMGGQTLHVTKAPDSGETYVDIDGDPAASGGWAVASTIADAIGGTVLAWWKTADPAAWAEMTAVCNGGLISNNWAAVGTCVKSIADRASAAYLTAHPVPTAPNGWANWREAPLLQKTLATAARAVKVLNVASFAQNFALGLHAGIQGGSGVLLRNNTLPPANGGPGPGGTAGGDPCGAAVPSTDSCIMRDPSSGRSVLVKPSGTVLNIADGGTFRCLAATWVVWDVAGVKQLNTRPARNATCGDAGPRTWDVGPAGAGGNIPNNVLLREHPTDAGDNPQATWLINSRGEIQSIPDGGTYLCLAYTNPVIWDVRYVDVTAWRPVGTRSASCG